MGIESGEVINLTDPRIIEFVNSESRQLGDHLDVRPDAAISAANMTAEGERPQPGRIQAFEIVTAIKRNYSIIKNRSVVSRCSLVLPLTTTVGISAATVLGVDKGVTQDIRTLIQRLFVEYDFGTHGPIGDYVSRKAAEHQVPHDAYGTFLALDVAWKGGSLDVTQENWLRELYEGNGRESAPELFQGDHRNLGDLGYSIEKESDDYLLSTPPPPAHGRHILKVPAGRNPDEYVAETAKKHGRAKDCDPDGLPPVRITSVRLPDHEKWEWKWAYIENDCGGGFHFWTSVHYRRRAETVLYATLTYAKADARFRHVFEECVREAALDATVAGIVFGSFDDALLVFRALVRKCAERSAREALECFVPSLYLTEETGEWEED